jgi:REP element-mobilizing transposase RayT
VLHAPTAASICHAIVDASTPMDRYGVKRPFQRHSESFVLIHIVWATFRRKPLLPTAADAWLSRMLRRKAVENGCIVFAVGNTADHVHILVRLAPTVSLAVLVQRLKGASSYAWNLEHANRIVWQEGYWAESVRVRDLAALQHYVSEQRRHHQTPAVREPNQEDAVKGSSSNDDSPAVAGLARGALPSE